MVGCAQHDRDRDVIDLAVAAARTESVERSPKVAPRSALGHAGKMTSLQTLHVNIVSLVH
jgi:hypothetical protein